MEEEHIIEISSDLGRHVTGPLNYGGWKIVQRNTQGKETNEMQFTEWYIHLTNFPNQLTQEHMEITEQD